MHADRPLQNPYSQFILYQYRLHTKTDIAKSRIQPVVVVRRVVVVLRFWGGSERSIEVVRDFRFLLTVARCFLTITAVSSELVSSSDADDRDIDCAAFSCGSVGKRGDDDLRADDPTDSCTLNPFSLIVLGLVFSRTMVS